VLARFDIECPGFTAYEVANLLAVDEHAAGEAEPARGWLDALDSDSRAIECSPLIPLGSKSFG
jgi:hypothetical protein